MGLSYYINRAYGKSFRLSRKSNLGTLGHGSSALTSRPDLSPYAAAVIVDGIVVAVVVAAAAAASCVIIFDF